MGLFVNVWRHRLRGLSVVPYQSGRKVMFAADLIVSESSVAMASV